MGILAVLRKFFSEPPDPLDELLVEKGIDPDKLLIDVKLRRMKEGEDNPINRAIERCDQKRDTAKKMIRDMMSN